MSKINEKRKLKQNTILSAAQDEFLAYGYSAANMDRIAKSAQVTKQTVYRYFPSKTELFKSTLSFMGEQSHQGYFQHLSLANNQEALVKFATGFIQAHIQEEHIATYRLLISECINEPEIVNYFFEQGPDDTKDKLSTFFATRLNAKHPEKSAQLWTSMLLSIRHGALLGRKKPSLTVIEEHINECNKWLFAALDVG